jgi:hypothetical protein
MEGTTFRVGSQIEHKLYCDISTRPRRSIDFSSDTIRRTTWKMPSSVMRLGQSGITRLECMEAAGSINWNVPGCRTRDKSPLLHKMEHAPPPLLTTSKPPKTHHQRRSPWHNNQHCCYMVRCSFIKRSQATCKQLSVRPNTICRSLGLELPSERIVQWAGLPSA